MSSGAPAGIVGPLLADVLADKAWRSCTVGLIAGGKSNLTFRVRSDAGSVILRRPPLCHVLPTAHDMGREQRVQAALAGSAVPVPVLHYWHPNPALLGQPFYVMEDVPGHVVRAAFPEGFADSPSEKLATCLALVRTLASLHTIEAASVGLADFGRPEGFVGRQLRRWRTQWDSTEGAAEPAVPLLAERLAAALPQRSSWSIVHGDFRLDNLVLDRDSPGQVRAVLDWEMATLGDPLTDLGLLLAYWGEASDDEPRRRGLVVPSVSSQPGMMTRTEIADEYEHLTGTPLDDLPWFVAFGFFKLAVVCAGIAERARHGAMLDRIDGYDALPPMLAQLGHAQLDELGAVLR